MLQTLTVELYLPGSAECLTQVLSLNSQFVEKLMNSQCVNIARTVNNIIKIELKFENTVVTLR